jgi:hypothetical protein
MTFVPGLPEPAGLHRGYLLRHTSIEGLCRWDCRFFQELANHGYLHEGYTNFFPSTRCSSALCTRPRGCTSTSA